MSHNEIEFSVKKGRVPGTIDVNLFGDQRQVCELLSAAMKNNDTIAVTVGLSYIMFLKEKGLTDSQVQELFKGSTEGRIIQF